MTNSIGFMQGRLCDMVNGQIQAFPWDDWQNEFKEAYRIGIHNMEWTLDQENLYDNPLMVESGREEIKRLSSTYNVDVISLTGDCFMQAPFWKASGSLGASLIEDFRAIVKACSILNIKIIVVPLVDNGSLESQLQEDKLVEILLLENQSLVNLGVTISFESDFSATNLQRFIKRLPSKSFGINYDIGNSASLGYEVNNEFLHYGDRVTNVHVKDRPLGGTTTPLGSGAADFEAVFKNLSEYKYQGNYILQTARDADGRHGAVIKNYLDMTSNWISLYES
jgi:hexulose-6-phosphate isomerase